MPYFSITQFNLCFLTIQIWGVFVGLAFVVGLFFIIWRIKNTKFDQIDILNLSVLVFIGAVVGARIGYAFLYPFSSFKDFLMLNSGGFTFHGGLLVAILLGWWYVSKKRLNFCKLADIFAPAIALGIFVGRIGCFLINDHIGTITKLPWGIVWSDGVMRHPIALYLSLNGLLLFFILWFLKNKFNKEGALFLFFLIYYSITRFLLDFLRVGDPKIGCLFISQWLSLTMVVVIGILSVKLFVIARERSERSNL
ncbi:MAG: prolipoprotein diacylglyceryl transferase family protein [bacterium]